MNYLLETYAQFVRWMLHLKRQPVFMIFSLAQPVLWLLLFSQAFEKTMAASPFGGMSDYTAFMTASVLVMTVFNNSLAGGLPVLFDREFGTLARVLAAPISRSSIVVGRFLAVSVVNVLQVGIILGLSMTLGVRVATGPLGALAIVGLVLLFGFGITALSLTLAFVFRSHVEFFSVLGMVGLPMVFISSALVPLEAMPGWLALLARANPMTYCIDGVRALVQVGWNATFLLRMAGALVAFDVVLMLLATTVISRKLD